MPLKFDATADEFWQYAEDSREQYQGQREVDDEAQNLYLQTHVVKVTDPDEGTTPQTEEAEPDPNQDIEPVGLGRAPLMVDQDAYTIAAMFTFRVNAAGVGPDAQEHATKLERFLDAVVLRMEELAPEPQWPKVRKDIVLYGRGVKVVFPVPRYWAGERFERHTDGEGKFTEDPDEFEKRRQFELRRHLPIIWRHWSAPDCYFRWYGEDDYSIVHYDRMLAGEIVSRHPGSMDEEGKTTGAYFLEEKIKKSEIRASEPVDVVEYLDSEWYGLMVGRERDVLIRWKHYMGVNPGVLFSGNPVPKNDRFRWAGALYHSRFALKAQDEAVSNMLTNLRRDTRALTVIYHDAKVEVGGEAKGRPMQIRYKPGGQLDLWAPNEKVERLGAARSNADYGAVISMLQGAVDDTGLRRVFMGSVKSDVTGTATRLTGEFAQLEMNDIAMGIRTAARKIGIRILHAPLALEEAVKDLRSETKPDKVYVRYEDRKRKTFEIAVGPDDVVNYDDLIQARWALKTPSDERAEADMLRLLAEDIPNVGPVLDIWRVRERFGEEDPFDIDKRVTIQRARNSPEYMAEINRLAAERFRGITQLQRDELAPEDVMALQALGLDEAILATLLGQQQETGAPPVGGGPSLVPSENRLREGEQIQ